jgi:hypothetical protein
MLLCVLVVGLFGVVFALECDNLSTEQDGKCVKVVSAGYKLDTEDIAEWLNPDADGGWSDGGEQEEGRKRNGVAPNWVPPKLINWNPLVADGERANAAVRHAGQFLCVVSLFAQLNTIVIIYQLFSLFIFI